eukprot:7037175-Prymnesium_polylepis.1
MAHTTRTRRNGRTTRRAAAATRSRREMRVVEMPPALSCQRPAVVELFAHALDGVQLPVLSLLVPVIIGARYPVR